MTERKHDSPLATDRDVAMSRLLSRLDEQKRLLQELATLAVSQRAMVDRSDAVGLLPLLAERQSVIERLARATDAGSREHEAWEATNPSAQSRREIQRRIDEIGVLHDGLASGDQRDCASLVRGREQMALELSGLSQGRRAMGAYSPDRAEGARYQDTKG